MAVNDPYAAYRRQVQITKNVNGESSPEAGPVAIKNEAEPRLQVVRPVPANSAIAPSYSAGITAGQYLESKVMSASPAELTLMLFDGSIRFMSQYIAQVNAKDIQGAHNAIMRAQDIFTELLITLDMSAEISQNMSGMYVFFLETLTTANLKKETEPVQQVIELTRELRATWMEAMKLCNEEQARRQPGSVDLKLSAAP